MTSWSSDVRVGDTDQYTMEKWRRRQGSQEFRGEESHEDEAGGAEKHEEG